MQRERDIWKGTDGKPLNYLVDEGFIQKLGRYQADDAVVVRIRRCVFAIVRKCRKCRKRRLLILLVLPKEMRGAGRLLSVTIELSCQSVTAVRLCAKQGDNE